jgi:hypothetical protein
VVAMQAASISSGVTAAAAAHPVARQETAPGPRGRVAVPVLGGHVHVEVLFLRAHRSEVERQPGLREVARLVDVLVDRDRHHRSDVDPPSSERPAFSTPARSGSRRKSGSSGLSRKGQPAVGDLATCSTAFGPDRAEVDRHVRHRLGQELERLAQAVRRAGASTRAVVLERASRASACARSRRTRACGAAAGGTARRTSPR